MTVMNLLPGEKIASRKLETIESGWIEIPDAQKTIHLQFRRFAGCPFCNVHLNTFIQRHNEIAAAGIREVVVFRSTASALQHHHGNAPFAIIADPQGTLYDEYGVGFGLRALADPRAFSMALSKIIHRYPTPSRFANGEKSRARTTRRFSDHAPRMRTYVQVWETRRRPMVGR